MKPRFLPANAFWPNKRRVFSAFLCLAVVMSGIWFVAQSQVSAQTDSINDNNPDLNTQLRGQILEYQRAEQGYKIAKQDYMQLQTLSSLQKAVDTSREVMRLRALVVETHLRRVKAELEVTSGIDESIKLESIAKLDELLIQIGEHQAIVSQIDDRFKVNAAADQFTTLVEAAEVESSRSVAQIMIGRLQATLSEGNSLLTELADLKPQQKQEIELTLKQAQEAIDQANTYLQQQKDNDNKQVVNQIQKQLDPAYVKLEQVLSYFREVTQS